MRRSNVLTPRETTPYFLVSGTSRGDPYLRSGSLKCGCELVAAHDGNKNKGVVRMYALLIICMYRTAQLAMRKT